MFSFWPILFEIEEYFNGSICNPFHEFKLFETSFLDGQITRHLFQQ